MNVNIEIQIFTALFPKALQFKKPYILQIKKFIYSMRVNAQNDGVNIFMVKSI